MNAQYSNFCQMVCDTSNPEHVSECKSCVSEVDSVPSTLQQYSSARVNNIQQMKNSIGYQWISRRVQVDQLCPVANSRVS